MHTYLGRLTDLNDKTFDYRAWRTALFTALVILVIMSAAFPAASADQPISRQKNVQLSVGDMLVVQSGNRTIQKVFMWGNLTVNMTSVPKNFPASKVGFVASGPGSYGAHIVFNYSEPYGVKLFVNGSAPMISNRTGQSPTWQRYPINPGTAVNATAYSLSGGAFDLDLNITVVRRQTPATTTATPTGQAETPWDGLVAWMGTFGQAFPEWVKFLYLLLGVQFFLVGGIWIRREVVHRKTTQFALDAGNILYMAVDVVLKFLTVTLGTIVAIMFGELLLLFVLQFMFLITLNLLSLWDVFALGFSVGAVMLTYLARFVMAKAFDLKPMEEM